MLLFAVCLFLVRKVVEPTFPIDREIHTTRVSLALVVLAKRHECGECIRVSCGPPHVVPPAVPTLAGARG